MNKKLRSHFMQKNIHLENNTPALFNKKSHKRISKPLTYINSDTGMARHFTPAAQEWFNSIYSYNHNYIKGLPSADKSLISLLKSYFNAIINPKLLIAKTKPTNIKRRYKRIRKLKSTPLRIRRKSTKRVFVGKGELKHTSKKIILTFYIYSTEGMVLSYAFKYLSQGLFLPWNKFKETVYWTPRKKKIIIRNRVYNMYEFLNLRYHYYWYMKGIISIITKVNKYLTLVNKYYKHLNKLVKKNVLTEKEKYVLFNDKVKSFRPVTYPNFRDYKNNTRTYYKREWFKYLHLLMLYKLKFTKNYLSKLNLLVNNIYKKKVVFNIVNLKKMHLNSDIFTQAVALKLRNKNNKLYRVLKYSLRKIKIIPVDRNAERQMRKPNRRVFFVNRIRNNLISDMFINNNAIGSLTHLIGRFYKRTRWNRYKHIQVKRNHITHRVLDPLKYFITKRLKHMKLRGIRVEAKGRLTRRASAARSVFKMRYKGGLKNIVSSFRGWSVIMLRGIVKSNAQYSVISSKNTNGAYGVKGWISSK